MKIEKGRIERSDTLNRIESRRNLRKVSKLENWINNLDIDKLKLIEIFCREEVERGKDNMCKNTLDIRKRAMELIKKGKNQSEAIKDLEVEFFEISKNSLINIYKDCKKEFKKEFSEDIEKAINYIFQDDKKINSEEINLNLKVTKMEVKGNNGIYLIDDKKISLVIGREKELIKFQSLKDLDDYRKCEIDKINKYCNEIKEVFNLKINKL